MFKKNYIKKYEKMFSKCGYTVTKYENNSLLIENKDWCGGFTIFNCGMCVGRLYKASLKEEKLKHYRLSQQMDKHPMDLGWLFYYEVKAFEKNAPGKSNFTLKEVKDMLQGKAAIA